MIRKIVHPGAHELRYEIRDIVKFGQMLAETGIKMTWENIGDPIAKGEEVPKWIREIVAKEVKGSSQSYAYSPTKGLASARNFLARSRSQEMGATLKAENVIFFNGLGDAISNVYSWLDPKARVLGPNPSYPSHSSLESAHANSPQLTYNLDPSKGWLPDVKDVRAKVKQNPNICALLIISPDNPTGTVYPREILEGFVKIARQYNLFLIADETYAHLAFNGSIFVSMAEVAGSVPTIIMRGLSKEIPWPGSRCGWLEFYNIDTDKNFAQYVQAIEEAKTTEVCSTTLPQAVLPAILGDKRYPKHLAQRQAKYMKRAKEAVKTLGASPSLNVVMPGGAFYLAVTFSEQFLKEPFTLVAANPQAQKLLDGALASIPKSEFDKRFCHQLMASTGICTVPLSTGFNSYIPGFRMTLLESDNTVFTKMLNTIVRTVH